jgi:hypothetical protein
MGLLYEGAAVDFWRRVVGNARASAQPSTGEAPLGR